MCLDADVIETVRRHDRELAPAVLGVDRPGRLSLLAHAPGEDCYQTDESTVREVVRRWVGVQARVTPWWTAAGRDWCGSLAGPSRRTRCRSATSAATCCRPRRTEVRRPTASWTRTSRSGCNSSPGRSISIRSDGLIAEAAGSRPDDPDLSGYLVLDFAAFDAWYEEDEAARPASAQRS